MWSDRSPLIITETNFQAEKDCPIRKVSGHNKDVSVWALFSTDMIVGKRISKRTYGRNSLAQSKNIHGMRREEHRKHILLCVNESNKYLLGIYIDLKTTGKITIEF